MRKRKMQIGQPQRARLNAAPAPNMKQQPDEPMETSAVGWEGFARRGNNLIVFQNKI